MRIRSSSSNKWCPRKFHFILFSEWCICQHSMMLFLPINNKVVHAVVASSRFFHWYDYWCATLYVCTGLRAKATRSNSLCHTVYHIVLIKWRRNGKNGKGNYTYYNRQLLKDYCFDDFYFIVGTKKCCLHSFFYRKRFNCADMNAIQMSSVTM